MSAPVNRPRGRPPLDPAARESETIAFRLTPAEAEALDARGGNRHEAARGIVRAALRRRRRPRA